VDWKLPISDLDWKLPNDFYAGALLFLTIFNDLANTTKNLKFYLIANDTNIYFQSQTLGNLFEKVINELKYVKRWLDANRLILNVSKSN